MGYAVELYFDGPTSRVVRAIWERIESAGLAGFMPTSGARPHVSLAVYSHIVPSEIEPLLSSFSREVGETKIRFGGVATFPGVVFLAPKLTPSLRNLVRFRRGESVGCPSCRDPPRQTSSANPPPRNLWRREATGS